MLVGVLATASSQQPSEQLQRLAPGRMTDGRMGAGLIRRRLRGET